MPPQKRLLRRKPGIHFRRRPLHLAVAQTPADMLLDDIGETSAFLMVLGGCVRPAFNRLGHMLGAHRQMEPVQHVPGRTDARDLAEGPRSFGPIAQDGDRGNWRCPKVEGCAIPARRSLVVLVVASVAIPWLLYPLATGTPRADALAPAALWASFWPVLLGAVLVAMLYRLRNCILLAPEDNALPAGSDLARAAALLGETIERLEGELRQWPLASLCLLVVAILLCVTMLVAR